MRQKSWRELILLVENMNTGWIKLYGNIKDHWIWDNEKKLKWWLDLLISVNYVDRSVLIKGTVITCKRGQIVRSLDGWAKEWGVAKSTVKNFLNLLKTHQMIEVENLLVTTRITICNYGYYQDKENGGRTLSERHSTPIKERKNKRNISSKELVTHEQFYEEQLKACNNDSNYAMIVNFIYGKVENDRPLTNVLSIKEQLSSKQCFELAELCNSKERRLRDLLLALDNDRRYYEGKTSVYLTLKGWLTKN
jgi:hypothetical protein